MGIFIREAQTIDIPGIAKVQVDTWRTTYRNLIPSEFLEKLSYQQKEKMWEKFVENDQNEVQYVYVAVNDFGDVVGFISFGESRVRKDKFNAEIHAIYIIEERQKQGIGKLLLKTAVQKLLEHNLKSMYLWVLAKNPAEIFYRSLGGKIIDRKTIEISNQKFIEIAYGWEDIEKSFR